MKSFFDTLTGFRKLRLGWAALTDGAIGILSLVVGYFGEWFNESKLAEKLGTEDARLYIDDVKDFSVFLSSVMNRHSAGMSAITHTRYNNIIGSVDRLVAALEDAKLEEDEITGITDAIRKSIDEWSKG